MDITGNKFCTINLILRVRVLEAGSYVVENLNGLLSSHYDPDRSKFEELLIYATKHNYKLFELDATAGLTIVALCKDVVVEKVELIE